MAASGFDIDDLTPEGVSSWDDLFPFPSFREKQRQTMIAVVQALHDPQYDNVVVDAPTGVGKSAINVAAARSFEDAFYITPQKKLREQLQADDILSAYYESLRSRRDYTCGVTGTDCDSCKINKASDSSCSEYARGSEYAETHDEGHQCTYWNAKLDNIDTAEVSDRADVPNTSVLTFAYLVIDGGIPPTDGNGSPISFSDRDLLIVDECHGLEGQVASLFAGFKVSPWTVPPDCYRNIARHLDMETSRHGEVMGIMETLQDRCHNYVLQHEGEDDYAEQVDDAKKFLDNAEWFMKEVEEWDRDWVVDMDKTRHPDKNKKVKSFQLKPVKVDSFLKNKVWRRADTRLLTTATMPYRGNTGAWCQRIGLDADRTHVIKVGMPFPTENRPVHVHTEIDKMSGGGDDRNWNKIMAELERLAGKHDGENGLVHTASYKRAQRVYKSVKKGDYPNLENNVLFHDADKEASPFITKWQKSDENVMLSPSMTEGVDLEDDMCRWQVLLKVPYPNMGDSRVGYLMDADTGYGKDWQWYNETTAQSVIQSVGRAVRSKDDYADFYVLDESFESVRNQVAFPDWFEAAITSDPAGAQKNATTAKNQQDPLDF